MTREQYNKHKNVIEAWGKGEKIDFWDSMAETWRDATDQPVWDNKDYRIKPQPEYIPFDYSDAHLLIGAAVKAKDGSFFALITGIEDDGSIYIESNISTFLKLLTDYTFLDDTPCGKLKTN